MPHGAILGAGEETVGVTGVELHLPHCNTTTSCVTRPHSHGSYLDQTYTKHDQHNNVLCHQTSLTWIIPGSNLYKTWPTQRLVSPDLTHMDHTQIKPIQNMANTTSCVTRPHSHGSYPDQTYTKHGQHSNVLCHQTSLTWIIPGSNLYKTWPTQQRIVSPDLTHMDHTLIKPI